MKRVDLSPYDPKPVDLSTYVPAFKIFIGGKLQPELRKSAVSLSIDEKVGGDPSQLTLVIADKFDYSTEKFVWLEKFLSPDGPLFNKEEKIVIHLGYEGYLRDDLISANLKTISTSGFAGDITRLTLVAFDTSHSYLTNKSTCSKDNLTIIKGDTYSTIATRLAEKANLQSEVEETKKYRDVTTKKYTTYLEFLKDAANRTGFEFFITRNTLYFIDPRIARNRHSKLERILPLKWHVNLQEFVPSIDTASIVPFVEIRGIPFPSKKEIVEKTSVGKEKLIERKEGTVTGSQIAKKLNLDCAQIKYLNFSTREEATDIANAHLNITSDKLITASCSIVGNPDLMPGQYVDIEGVGKQLSGMYFVTGVTNTIDGSGYTTRFNVRRNNIIIDKWHD